jgi:hypothetical protein
LNTSGPSPGMAAGRHLTIPPNATTGSAPPSNLRPDGELRFHKRSQAPVDDPCAECRSGDRRTVWLLADSLNPDCEPEALHYVCAPVWFDRASSDAAPAGGAAAASPPPTDVLDTCARCVDSTGALAIYHPRTRQGDRDGEVFLDLCEGDGPGAVRLHPSCWHAWLRVEAKRRGLRLGGLRKSQ